ncbi:hypothetical protein ACFY4C_25455 [Actinomadura viridis]|uniref:hypothetical protein n=1 Tax=Actinomadura viridis TaxID=58110 RepID=UPI0036C2D8F1
MNPRCERCDGALIPVEYGMPVDDEPYRRHERREIYFTGSCMGGPEPWWCWSCEAYADPEPRPPRSLTKEGYQLALLDDMRRAAPEAPLEPPAPYDDPPARLLEEAGRWQALESQKIEDLSAILGDPVSGGPSRHRFALPLWPDFWLEHTTMDTPNGGYVLNRRFVRRSGAPMRSADRLRPWSVLLPEAQAFFDWEENRMPNAYRRVVPFQLQGRRMKACFVYDLLQHVSESPEG